MRLRKLILAVVSAIVCLPVWGQAVAPAAADSCDTSGRPETIIESIRRGNNIVVEMPDDLARRMEARQDTEANPSAETQDASDGEQKEERYQRPNSQGKIVGYRVQIYADNNARIAKAEARMRERAVGGAFPYNTYVTYSSPYWRLRVGDFRTQDEASKAAAAIRKRFPKYAREVRVVRDHVYAR